MLATSEQDRLVLKRLTKNLGGISRRLRASRRRVCLQIRQISRLDFCPAY